MFGLGDKTPGRTHISVGDWICFYASRTGIVGHGKVDSVPERVIDADLFETNKPMWSFRLAEVKLYLSEPVVIDRDRRRELDAYRGRPIDENWGWFVQATRKITEHDFRVLTRS